MKWLFLLLLMANLVFFSWNYFSESEIVAADKTGISSPASPDQLKLLSELTRDEMPPLRDYADKEEEKQPVASDNEENDEQVIAQAEAPVEVPEPDPVIETPAQPQKQCFRMTDIVNKKALQTVLQVLEKEKGEVLSKGETQIQIKKYWVMLPPYKSRSEAISAIKQLKNTKVKDYYRIRSGDYVNAISLGVFSTNDAAKRRVSKVRAQTAKIGRPKIEEIEFSAKRFWVVYSGPPEPEESEWRKKMEKAGSFELNRESCPAENL